MVSKEQFLALRHGQNIQHVTLKNSDGTPLRARLNGAVKTWKTRPADFQAPMKHGLKNCFYITQDNCHEWVAS